MDGEKLEDVNEVVGRRGPGGEVGLQPDDEQVRKARSRRRVNHHLYPGIGDRHLEIGDRRSGFGDGGSSVGDWESGLGLGSVN